MTKVLGLTGAIASGKSFVGNIFSKMGVDVLDVDKEVHSLLAEKAIVEYIAENFPGGIIDGKVNRKALGEIVFSDKSKLDALEKKIHPLVRQREEEFIQRSKEAQKKLCVLEVTLLHKTGADQLCDYIIKTEVDRKTQKKRALEREHMTEDKFESIVKNQEGIFEGKIDKIVDTNASEAALEEIVKDILGNL
jgi:dephospho-CoA kinase